MYYLKIWIMSICLRGLLFLIDAVRVIFCIGILMMHIKANGN